MIFGLGGPLYVVRALAIDGRTVRVVFDEAPRFLTPAGVNDALNPANYGFAIDAGDATAPIATVVEGTLVEGPARGVGNGGEVDERGVDVHVDRPLVVGISYRVSALGVVAAAGGELGDPSSATFFGVVPAAQPSSQRGRPTTNVDVACDVASGSWFGDGSGDIAIVSAREGYRQRVFRRLTTPRDAFSFLKGYGVGQRLKGPGSPTLAGDLKVDAEQQIALEPETARVSVGVTIAATGVTTFDVKAWTRVGAFIEMGVEVDASGAARVLTSA